MENFHVQAEKCGRVSGIRIENRRILSAGVIGLPKDRTPVLRLEPEKRLCPLFDPATIARYPIAEPGEMGFRVLDNFCEEHIQ